MSQHLDRGVRPLHVSRHFEMLTNEVHADDANIFAWFTFALASETYLFSGMLLVLVAAHATGIRRVSGLLCKATWTTLCKRTDSCAHAMIEYLWLLLWCRGPKVREARSRGDDSEH